MTVLNAACDAGFYYAETLAALRRDLMIGLGYAAQADNPPTGMATLLDNFLKRAQNVLYRKLQGTDGELERWFQWTMVVDERFYGILSNTDSCAKKLRADQVSELWLEDANGTWTPMIYGIPPSVFTMVTQPGRPVRYEIRQNIEVFPAPDQAYTLHAKGRFGVLPFTDDADVCSVDPDLLYLWALARAKNHYGQGDARDTAAEAQSMLGMVIAASHKTRRYIPNTVRAPDATRPRFLGLE